VCCTDEPDSLIQGELPQGLAVSVPSRPGIRVPPLAFCHSCQLYRGDRSRSRRRDGTSLGLALVHSITEAHSGKISIKSQLGSGNGFAMSLPLTSSRSESTVA
jgi:signal transduction histidine kinase